MSVFQAKKLNEKLSATTSLSELFDFLLNENLGNITFSTSLGQEDQVITHHITTQKLPVEIFTLDTGRLFQETYDVLDITQRKFKTKINVFAPNTKAVENLVTTKGPNSFYESVENRKECCNIRKIEPLKRALTNKDVWVTGLRQSQSQNRSDLDFFSYDTSFGILKFNPLLHWSLEGVTAYLDQHNVPQNKLHTKGYVSIGCAPCTRAIESGEDLRAGRWWWENSKKECGLHTIKS